MPSVAPPSPQEINRKLSIHTPKVHSSSAPSSAGVALSVSGTESDSDSFHAPDLLTPTAHHSSSIYAGTSSSQPPLSSIAERRSGSGGEDSDDEEDVAEGGWKTANVKTTQRGSLDESVIKSGYLWKKGERRKTWKKRWFVLRPAHLAYYKSSAEYQLLRLLELSDVHSCTQVTLKRHDNTFGLISPVRTFYLQASSAQDVREWVKAIEDARQTLMSTSTQTSASTPIPIPKAKENLQAFTSSPPGNQSQLHNIITSSDSEDASPAQPTVPSPTRTTFAASPMKPATSTKDLGKVVLSGYLMKCGSKRRNWRKRWFVLTGEKLVYSGSHMDTKPHRQFPFSEILDALEFNMPTSRQAPITPVITSTAGGTLNSDIDDSQRTHTFKVVTTKRTLLLCAPSEEDEIRWLSAFRAMFAWRSGSGVVPGVVSKSTSSSQGIAEGSMSPGGNVGNRNRTRRLSAGGVSGLSGAIPEDARET